MLCRCGVYASRGIASTGNFFVQTLNQWHNHRDNAMDYLNRRSTTSEMKETDNFSVTSELCGGIRIGFPLESQNMPRLSPPMLDGERSGTHLWTAPQVSQILGGTI